MVIATFGWIEWFFSDDAIARWIALVIWIAITGMLSIPAHRRLFGRPRYIDDLLFAAWLLTLNRVCYSVQALVHNDTFADLTRWSGILAAAFYGYVVTGYIWPNGEVRQFARRAYGWVWRA